MKKIINILLVLICALTIFSFFCGCGNSQKHDYSEEEKTIGKQAITYAHQYIKGEMSSDKAYKKLYDLYTKCDDDNELSDEIYKLSLNILYEDVDVSIIEDNIEKIEDLINLSYAYNLDAESILNEDNDKETSSEDETVKETETQAPTVNPKKIEQNYKKTCKNIDFKTLARNPEKYKGNHYKFTGEVIQVQESSWNNFVDLRIDVTKNEYGFWEDTIYATVEIPEGEDKILEDDILTFWGTCEGEYTYESVFGKSITLPLIDINYFEINE